MLRLLHALQLGTATALHVLLCIPIHHQTWHQGVGVNLYWWIVALFKCTPKDNVLKAHCCQRWEAEQECNANARLWILSKGIAAARPPKSLTGLQDRGFWDLMVEMSLPQSVAFTIWSFICFCSCCEWLGPNGRDFFASSLRVVFTVVVWVVVAYMLSY